MRPLRERARYRGAGRGTSPVGAELDEVAGGVTDVEATAVAARAEEVGGAHLDGVATRRGELVQVDALDDEGDVVDVLARAVALEEIDDRVLVDAQRDERHL